MRAPRILVTGFDAFGGETVNPSWQVAQALDGRRIAGHTVVARELPTDFVRSLLVLKAALREVAPVIVLGIGQAGGRPHLSVERVAINVIDARIPDNAGAQPVDQPVIAGGPAAWFSTLPVKAMLAALLAEGLPAAVSQTAGTYVCNQVAYAMLHFTAKKRGVRAGFLHIPYLPEQAARHPGAPSMALADMLRGVRVALRAAIAAAQDLPLGAGATH